MGLSQNLDLEGGVDWTDMSGLLRTCPARTEDADPELAGEDDGEGGAGGEEGAGEEGVGEGAPDPAFPRSDLAGVVRRRGAAALGAEPAAARCRQRGVAGPGAGPAGRGGGR